MTAAATPGQGLQAGHQFEKGERFAEVIVGSVAGRFFPDPETPVNATKALRGMSTSTAARLCSVAPRTRTYPSHVESVTDRA